MKTDNLTIKEIIERIKALVELQQEQYNPYRERNIQILKNALLKLKCGNQLV